MLKRWIFYLTALLGCTIFWSAHQGWISWLLLQILLWLPWLSLTLSLIPMLRLRPRFSCPSTAQMGADEQVTLYAPQSILQVPYECRLQVQHTPTGTITKMKPGDKLPTAHCGELLVSCPAFYVNDLLGLFCLPRNRLAPTSILVRPTAVAMDAPRELERFRANAWMPKVGGGFAENHEMRLYRPGDSLNQVHWKLTAKTGKLMIRQPMIPRCGTILLTVDICGTPEELDLKMGRILWLGEYLLDLELPFRIQALGKNGVLSLPAANADDFQKAMDQLLRCPPAEAGTIQSSGLTASWHFHIGGEPDET